MGKWQSIRASRRVSRLESPLHYLRRRTEGTQLLELAFVLPMLAVLVVGVADFGAAFALRDKLANAAREGARIASGQSTADLLQANPLTVQSARNAVVNYLNGAGAPATLSSTVPCATAVFSWTYCLSNGGRIRFQRQHTVSVGGTLVLCTKVTIIYPHTWTINRVLRLIVPTSSLPASFMIPVESVMRNQT